MASSRGLRSRRSATTFHLDAGPKLQLPARGSGSRRRTRSPTTGRTRPASPSRSPTRALSSRTRATSSRTMIDPGFFNDQYKLLFPFHLIWDTGATVEDAGMQKLPLGKGKARKVVMKYPVQRRLTPGDTWELYVGPTDRIRELLFRHGGSAKPRVFVATYARPQEGWTAALLAEITGQGRRQARRASSSPTWRSSWWGQTPGWRRSKPVSSSPQPQGSAEQRSVLDEKRPDGHRPGHADATATRRRCPGSRPSRSSAASSAARRGTERARRDTRDRPAAHRGALPPSARPTRAGTASESRRRAQIGDRQAGGERERRRCRGARRALQLRRRSAR